jgi:chromosome segregation ATPase
MPIEFAEYYNQMSVINEKFSNLDEATRYQLAFHAARTALKTQKQNLTPASLIKSIAGMVKVLDTEKREFEAQNDQGYQSNLVGVQKKAQEMSQGIKDRENRLQALQKEIDAFLAAKSAEKKKLDDERAQLISQRVVAEGEMNQLGQKKTERETKFNTALEAHRQRLDELKSELEEHLKNIT